jgi:Helix-turn-helix domain
MDQVKPVYVSDKEASTILGVARQTLANWRHMQRGPRYSKGERICRYAVEDLLAFMETRKIGTEDQPK